MDTFITIMAIAFALFLIYKFVKATNRHNASKAFIRGYFSSGPDELRAIVAEHSRSAFVSMNVASVLLGRLAAKEAPNLDPASVAIAFAEQWNNDHVLIRAQQLDRMVSQMGMDSALYGVHASIDELYA